jgi:tellurite resistance protein
LRHSVNPHLASIRFALLWIASADGQVDDAERKFIADNTRAYSVDEEMRGLETLVDKQDLPTFFAIFQFVRDEIRNGKINGEALLRLAVQVAVNDKRLTMSENYALCFLSDLAGLEKSQFKKIFAAAVGRDWVAPSDPSSPEWWRQAEAAKQAGIKPR